MIGERWRAESSKGIDVACSVCRVAIGSEEYDQLQVPRYRCNKLTLGLLVEVSEVLPLLLVDDGEDTGDRLADSVASQHQLCSCMLARERLTSW